MDWVQAARNALNRQDDNGVAALVYALLAIEERLERIDDALRNTVGGRS